MLKNPTRLFRLHVLHTPEHAWTRLWTRPSYAWTRLNTPAKVVFSRVHNRVCVKGATHQVSAHYHHYWWSYSSSKLSEIYQNVRLWDTKYTLTRKVTNWFLNRCTVGKSRQFPFQRYVTWWPFETFDLSRSFSETLTFDLHFPKYVTFNFPEFWGGGA